MEMCKGDEILMELGITQLLLNYNSFLQDSETSIVTWLISLLYYQCFLLDLLNYYGYLYCCRVRKICKASFSPHWELVLQAHPVCLYWVLRDAVILL